MFALTRVGGSPIGIYLSHEMSPAEVAEIEERFHLNDPLPVQYFYWARGVLSGDLGWSGVAAAPVTEVFPNKLAATMELAVAAGLVAVTLGIALGHLCRRPAQPAARSHHPRRGDQRRLHAALLVRHPASHRLLGAPGLVPDRQERSGDLRQHLASDRPLYGRRHPQRQLRRRSATRSGTSCCRPSRSATAPPPSSPA